MHHSDTFRAAYAPHYRVVSLALMRAWPVFLLCEQLLAAGSAHPILAIDGRCGAGKSSLAALLQGVYGCNVFHMDDYFLPPPLRTPARLATPGGNVHYERFAADVLVPLQNGLPTHYRPYQCWDDTLAPEVPQPSAPFAVVEGSYSLHPTFGCYADAAVFLTAAEPARLARIEARNGPEMLRRFITEWIPLEEAYFQACAVPQRCTLCLDTSLW